MTVLTSGFMTVRVEVWALGADTNGIWLVQDEGLDGPWGSWLSDPIPAYTDMHSEVLYIAAQHGIRKHELLAVHSTSAEEPGAWSSWHPDGTSVVHTYMAPVCVADGAFVPELWPYARPVTAKLFEVCGQPEAYHPVDAPAPRDSSILFHGLRHLRHLIDTDTDHAEALGDIWDLALTPFTPVLATMYHRKPEPVA